MCHAPNTLGAITLQNRSTVCSTNNPSSSTPAACTIPRRGGIVPEMAANTVWRANLSATSAHAMTTSMFELRKSATAAFCSADNTPVRPVRTRCFAPRDASQCETARPSPPKPPVTRYVRSEEHTSELQSQSNLVCRLLLEKKNNTEITTNTVSITNLSATEAHT